MCRYAAPYKGKWACFTCRKSFRIGHAFPKDQDPPVLCPQCAKPMLSMGLDFKAPKQIDVEQWRKVELLAANGFRYFSCGCNGPGPRPRRLKEVPKFLEEQKQISATALRKQRLEQRAAELKTKRKKSRLQVELKRLAKLETT